MRFTAIVIATALGCASTALPEGEALNLGDLPAGAEVRIRYASEGCFHREKRAITIRGGPQPVAIVSTGPPNTPPNGSGGQVALSPLHLQKLSNLLAFYRSSPEGECTTRDEVVVTYKMPGARDYSEHFEDETCASGERSDVLDLWTLVRWSSGLADPDAPQPRVSIGTARELLHEHDH